MQGLLLLAGDATIAQSMGEAFGKVQGDALSCIATVAPYGLAIMGAFLVWGIGTKFFKKVAK